jgi:glycine cleavage system H lipoate-binding protein
MITAIETIQAIGIFVVGLVARAGIVVGVIALLSVPFVLFAYVMRAVEQVKARHLGLRDVAGVVFRPDLWYSPTHTWLGRRPGGQVAIGLDALAARLLPSITGVEVPRVGTTIEKGQPLATLFAGARSLTIPAPVSGTVTAFNRGALRNPGLVKSDGYGRGWIVALKPVIDEVAALPRGDKAERFIRQESARWDRFVESELCYAAADGGHLVAPVPALVGEAGWRKLAAAFAGAKS